MSEVYLQKECYFFLPFPFPSTVASKALILSASLRSWELSSCSTATYWWTVTIRKLCVANPDNYVTHAIKCWTG